MAVNKKLLQGAAAAAPGGLTPSEHFGVVLYEGDGSSSHSINGGKFGAGAYFNGSNGYINFSDRVFNVPLNGTLSEFSISLWFNASSVPSSGNIEFLSWWQTGNQTYKDGFLGLTTISSNSIRFGDDWQNAYTFSSTSEMVNQWYHLVAVKTSTNAYIYLNGQLESTKGSALDWGFNNFLAIGRQHTAGEYFDGKLDQVRLFSKALSSSEVSTLYAETAETVESLDPLSEDTTDTLQVLGDSSCIATYRFENDEVDLSGNYNGTGTEIQYAAGRYGQAASFGSNSKVQLPSGSPFNDSDTIKSISAWVKADTTSSRVYPFSIGSSTIEDDFFNFGWIPANNYILLFIRDGSSANQASHSAPLTADTNWHHIVVQTTGSAVQIFIDGESKTVTSSYSGTGSASSWISYPSYGGSVIGNIGANAALNPVYSNGKIDQVRFFNKALSASEVTTLYQENSLVASYRFEGNANDDTRNYDGTATNVSYEYGLNFTPDFVWIKGRTNAIEHVLSDSSRGVNKELSPDSTQAEENRGVQSFDTGGFTLDNTSSAYNFNGVDYVAWCLKANGGTTSSNTDGTITSTVQANQDAGFSIVKWTGTQTNGSIGHGLTAAPEMLIVKDTTNTYNWYVFIKPSGATNNIRIEGLNTTAAGTVQNSQFTTTSSLIENLTIYASLNTTGATMLAYAFHSVEGFSKIGSYTGNGSTNGPIVETGFEPAFVMIKGSSLVSQWNIVDNRRDTINPATHRLFANLSNAEATGINVLNFLSNGFEIVNNDGGYNSSGQTYIYMAFAADPDTEAPTVAKSFTSVAYTGAGGTQSIDGFGFSPSLIWIKNRTNAYSHQLYDSVRGAGNDKNIQSDNTSVEGVDANLYGFISSFDSDGYTVQSGTATGFNNIWTNQSGQNYVAWAWKADDNEPTINTEGSINSLVSANANAGFSIVKYEGNGTSGATIGHGLSSTPEMIIIRNLDTAGDWVVGHTSLGFSANKFLKLNLTNSVFTNAAAWASTNPTSTTFTLGGGSLLNNNGDNHIAYCFHSVSGYSKIGTYTGNGTTNAITGLGFQPDWILAKRTDTTDNWAIIDSVREAYFLANLSDAEATYNWFAFTSDGFTLSTSTLNKSGGTYIYAAFKIN